MIKVQCYTFTYDDNGIRQSKLDDWGRETLYFYDGNLLIAERSSFAMVIYMYDNMNAPIGFNVVLFESPRKADADGRTYWYKKNLQGEIIGLYSEAGQEVATYLYDPYGNIISRTYTPSEVGYADYNRLFYRGYYYDNDLGLYYLGSRYYDANIGRFVSPDAIDVVNVTPMALTDKNLYAYCDNNPIMRVDNGGEFWLTVGIMAVGGLIGSAISAVSSIVSQQITTGEINWASVGVAAASGFVSGAVAASPLGVVGQVVAGGVVGGLSYVADAYVTDKEINADEAVVSIVTGSISGLVGGKGANSKGVLTKTINETKNTITRETRRANQKYAVKAIARAKSALNCTLESAIWTSSFNFLKGTTVANTFNYAYGTVRSCFAN